jgi:4-hydroxy-tetrahydrodipicolinate reductase
MRVGVAGALGRLGRVASAAIDAADDLHLAAGFARSGAGDRIADRLGFGGDARIFDALEDFYGAGMDVVVDCTVYPVTIDVTRSAIDLGVSPVIGATGWTDEDVVVLQDACDEANIGAMLVPNFSVGAVLMMKFAAQAAKVMPHAEIIELHHDGKRDAPSGTSKLTAQRMREAGGLRDVPIHSVRLPGLVAHQEVIFGGVGETLTIRHDSLARESFAAGILLATRAVRSHPGLTVGLDSLLFPEAQS